MEIHNLNPELKTFLKVLQKSGYPNTTPDVPTIAKAISYPLDNFVIDLVNEIGEEKTKDFIRKTFKSLGLMSNTGMKIDLNFTGEKGSYIYLIIHNFDIVLDEPEEPVWIHYSYGDSLIIQDGEEKTLEDVEDEVDMGTMGEFSDYMDEIGYECVGEIIRKTGIVTHYDSRI
jgi:hypothetical protein